VILVEHILDFGYGLLPAYGFYNYVLHGTCLAYSEFCCYSHAFRGTYNERRHVDALTHIFDTGTCTPAL
jgi:hypothetical protein